MRSDRTFKRTVIRNGKAVMFSVTGEEGASSFTLEESKVVTELNWDAEIMREMGFVNTDAGIYLATDLGVHHREERSSYRHMPECILIDTGCWYSGSSLAAFELARQWADAGFDEQVIRYALEGVYEAEFLDG